MKSDKEVINNLQSRLLAYDVMFQSIYSSLPDEVKAQAIANVEENFKSLDSGTHSEDIKATLATAKVIASRVTGAKL